ncbi:MAG TPA: OsmC family protein [Fimbriimonadaceae bacterium]|nr:OsmC family protein [Fimbriimonadaceae bacterium]
MVNLTWKGGLAFEAVPPSGKTMTFDSTPDGSEPHGASPMEALLAAIAACSAMDVISILEKKRQKVTSYRIEIEGERSPEGEWPRPFTKIEVRHIVSGESIDPDALARSVQLSDEKYCSVLATLRLGPEVGSAWAIE